MDDIESPHIPHFAVHTLMEVGVVVGLFGLALGCLACSLNGCEGPCSRLKLCWRKLLRRPNTSEDDDDDGESYIDDAESGRPAPHVFENLNELVFFEAPDEPEGVLNNEEEGGLLIPTSMEKIFPDLLAPKEEETPETSNDLREPLL